MNYLQTNIDNYGQLEKQLYMQLYNNLCKHVTPKLYSQFEWKLHNELYMQLGKVGYAVVLAVR